MTDEDMAKLSPREREAITLRRAGVDPAEIARRMGFKSRVSVYTLEWTARKRLAAGKPAPPPRVRPPKKMGAPLGSKADMSESEPPRVIRARIARELAEGLRCTHPMRRGPCSLLLPCADHDLALGLAT